MVIVVIVVAVIVVAVIVLVEIVVIAVVVEVVVALVAVLVVVEAVICNSSNVVDVEKNMLHLHFIFFFKTTFYDFINAGPIKWKKAD